MLAPLRRRCTSTSSRSSAFYGRAARHRWCSRSSPRRDLARGTGCYVACRPAGLATSLDDEPVEPFLGLRQLRIDALERSDEQLGDRGRLDPVVVGRDDIPRRVLGRCLLDHVVVGLDIVVEAGTNNQIVLPELPALLG